jgi:hypothetical protein
VIAPGTVIAATNVPANTHVPKLIEFPSSDQIQDPLRQTANGAVAQIPFESAVGAVVATRGETVRSLNGCSNRSKPASTAFAETAESQFSASGRYGLSRESSR